MSVGHHVYDKSSTQYSEHVYNLKYIQVYSLTKYTYRVIGLDTDINTTVTTDKKCVYA